MRTSPLRCSGPFAILCLAFVCAWSLFGQPSPNAQADAPKGTKPVAVSCLHPVLLIDGKEVKGQADPSVTYEKFRYLFASAANKAKFEKDPQRYAIQFHGQCAMMLGAAALPDLFTVYKGRIYA